MKRIALLVLGMHRSGTSVVTWMAGQLGAALPIDALQATDDNAKGYWESRAIVEADEQLLRVARSSWFDPRLLDLSRLSEDAIASRRRKIRDAITTAFHDAAFFVMKDPRQCRFVPVICEVLDMIHAEARVVLTLRSPAAIAASLQARDGMSSAFAHLLWMRHMLSAERDSRGLRRIVVDYDAILGDWQLTMQRLARLIDHETFNHNAEQADRFARFLDPGLRHHIPGGIAALDTPFADIVVAVADGLQRLVQHDDEEAHAALDAATDRLAAFPWIEDDIIHNELRHRRVGGDEPDAAGAQTSQMITGLAAPSSQILSVGTLSVSEAVARIRASGAFDEAWYRTRYADVADPAIDPIAHYLTEGARQGRNPGPLFDTGYYARQMLRRRPVSETTR